MLRPHNRLKGVGRVEVLAMVLLCLFLLAVTAIACRKSRFDAYRIRCGKNLSLIGKAMLVYATDSDGRFPRSGGNGSFWSGLVNNWRAADRFGAYGLARDGSGGYCSISSCFYLLVRHVGLKPESFICPGDIGAVEFRPADEGAGNRQLTDLWDFGSDPRKHCSYSYHMPYGLYTLCTTSEVGLAVAADRNPWIFSLAGEIKNPNLFNPDGGREAVRAGNAISHQDNGQNVLFVSGNAMFEERSFCGVNEDNIYTFWDGGDIRRGGLPLVGSEPKDKLDSLLVHDPIVPVRRVPGPSPASTDKK